MSGWTEEDLKVFAAGLAIGGKWNTSVADESGSIPKPRCTPDPGVYYRPVSAQLSTTVRGAVIRYTLDGSLPTADSKPYAGEILSTDEAMIIKAYAQLNNSTSGVAAFSFTVLSPYVETWNIPSVALSDGVHIAPSSARYELVDAMPPFPSMTLGDEMQIEVRE